ncbi:ATP-binding protein [Streptomyces sp. NPDC057638]|uniref:ATP-binding protein n=1 Tax=Streptomyces sp. NPDC057638 TaxID=3346190 RepID=UPI0036B4E865
MRADRHGPPGGRGRPAPGRDGDPAGDVLLVVSELVTNACLHAGGPTGLVLRQLSDGVRVEVADRSPEPPRVRARDAGRPGGHGLVVLERLARSWGWAPTADGKAVWAELPFWRGP